MQNARYHVYDQNGKYQGSVVELETAAAIISGIGDAGWTVQLGPEGGRHIVYREGKNRLSQNSYDAVAMEIAEREDRYYAGLFMHSVDQDASISDTDPGL